MKPIARFVIRPDENKAGGRLMLGIDIAQVSSLKPNTIYQIEDILGELVIREVGQAVIGKDGNELPYCNWGHAINDVLQFGDGKHLLTIEEARSIACIEKAQNKKEVHNAS